MLDTWRCMSQSTECSLFDVCTLLIERVNISLIVSEKGREKVGYPLGDNCYSSLLHTMRWTEEAKRTPRRGS